MSKWTLVMQNTLGSNIVETSIRNELLAGISSWNYFLNTLNHTGNPLSLANMVNGS